MRWFLTYFVALAGFAGAVHAQTLDLTFATTPTSGRYYPAHVMAVWVETPDGTFVRTLREWGTRRASHLVEWNAARYGSGESLDGITSATLRVDSPEDVSWDMRDASGAIVPDGDYVMHFELADSNSTSSNHRGQFSFTKGSTHLVEMMQESPFQPIELDYSPGAGSPGMPPPDAVLEDAGARIIPIGRGYGSRGCAVAPGPAAGLPAIASMLVIVLVRRRRA